MNRLRIGSMVIFFAFLVTGCAQTQQMREPVHTGFLGADYGKLQPGKKGEALLVYKNPRANWKNYDKVLIDPVQIWKDRDSQLREVSQEDLQNFANELYAKLTETLRSDYELVSHPAPGTLRISVAITEAEASDPALDTITSIIPQTRILTGAKGLVAGGKPGFVGAASAEAKITDAQTGELLAAGVDRRAGTKSVAGATNKWGDVLAAYQYWAEKLRWRLCMSRGETNCPEPKE